MYGPGHLISYLGASWGSQRYGGKKRWLGVSPETIPYQILSTWPSPRLWGCCPPSPPVVGPPHLTHLSSSSETPCVHKFVYGSCWVCASLTKPLLLGLPPASGVALRPLPP